MVMKNDLKTAVVLVVALQVFLMINAPVAESYSLNSLQFSGRSSINENYGKEILSFTTNLLVGFLTINQIGFASAVDAPSWCCAETNGGASCQNVPADSSS